MLLHERIKSLKRRVKELRNSQDFKSISELHGFLESHFKINVTTKSFKQALFSLMFFWMQEKKQSYRKHKKVVDFKIALPDNVETTDIRYIDPALEKVWDKYSNLVTSGEGVIAVVQRLAIMEVQKTITTYTYIPNNSDTLNNGFIDEESLDYIKNFKTLNSEIKWMSSTSNIIIQNILPKTDNPSK